MLFKLTNKRAKKATHCGVLEFVADEGKAYIPYWVSYKENLFAIVSLKKMVQKQFFKSYFIVIMIIRYISQELILLIKHILTNFSN